MTLPDSSSYAELQPETAARPESARPSATREPAKPPDPQRPSRAELSFCSIVCSLMMGVSMVMVSWNLQDASLGNAYTSSHHATIESLVDYGTYYIDQSRYVDTIDKYKVGDHFISSKQPALSTYAAGVYWVYQKVTGKTIAQHEGDVVRTLGFFTGALFHLVFLVFFYRVCRLLLKRDIAVILGVAAASFAFLGVAYATHINKHSPAAALGVCGLFYALRIGGTASVGEAAGVPARAARTLDFCVAGLVLGFMIAIDLPSLAFSGLVLLYLASHDWRRTLRWFVPALLPGLLCQLALSYEISGSLQPFQMNHALKQFKEFYFKNPRGMDALREPKWLYAFNVLLGHHGLFSMTPIYLFGFWELVRCLWRRVRLRESALVAATVAVLVVFYIFRTRNYGGVAVGMRWLVPTMPLLLLYFAFWVDRVRLTLGRWCSMLVAFLISAFNVQDGLTSPFQASVWQNWLGGTPNRARVGKRFNLASDTDLPRTPAGPGPDGAIRIDPRQHSGAFRSGWAPSEVIDGEPVRWAVGLRSVVQFSAAANGKAYTLRAELGLAPELRHQRLKLSLNGQVLFDGEAPERPRRLKADVPPEALRPGENQLTFEFAEAWRPGGDDDRELAAQLRSLELVPLTQDFDVHVGVAADAEHLTSGFSKGEVEGDIRFANSNGPASVVEGTLVDPGAPHVLELTARAIAGTSGRIRTFINDHALASVQLGVEWSTRQIFVSPALLRRGLNHVRFEYEETVTPAARDPGSTDERQLAVGFQRIQLEPVPLVTLLDLGTIEARAALLEGWSMDDEMEERRSVVWSVGARSSLRASLLGARLIELETRAYSPALPVRVDVAVDGQVVGTFHPSEAWSRQRVLLPVQLVSERPSVVELRFDHTARPARSEQGSSDQRELAIRVDRVEIVR